MLNTMWSKLNKFQLGRYAEYYAMMEFASYGFYVYTSEVDDHGIDFVAKHPQNGQYYEIQVKSSRKKENLRDWGYVYIQKDKMELAPNRLVCLLLLLDGKMPDCYVIPSQAWNHPDELLVSRDFGKEGQKSKPEWGINISQKNLPKLEQFRIEEFLNKG